jgi:hypothetical protein
MDDSSQQDSTKKKSTASTNMHRLIISPKPCRINQKIKAKADPRKSIPERGQKRAYHIIRYRPIYRIMHGSRSSSRPAELGRKEKERKKKIKVHSHTRGRDGMVRTLGKLLNSRAPARVQTMKGIRGIYLFIPEGKKGNVEHFRWTIKTMHIVHV